VVATGLNSGQHSKRPLHTEDGLLLKEKDPSDSKERESLDQEEDQGEEECLEEEDQLEKEWLEQENRQLEEVLSFQKVPLSTSELLKIADRKMFSNVSWDSTTLTKKAPTILSFPM